MSNYLKGSQKVRIDVVLDKSLLEQINQVAELDAETVSATIRKLIRLGLQK